MPTRLRLLALLLAAALPTATLAAEPAPAPSRVPASSPDPDYDAAVEALREGRWGTGARLLELYLLRDDAAHRAEAEALRDLARHLAANVEAGRPPGALDQRGRAELAVFSTLFGIWTGGLVTYLRGGDALVTTTVFGGTGLAVALAATSGREITEGRARLVSMGGFWGTLNAGAFAAQAGLTEDPLVTTMLVSGLAGIAAGAVLPGDAPDEGYLSLVNSAGLWSAYAASMVLMMADSEMDGEDALAFVIGGADFGLILAAVAAQDVEISQGRVRLIDLGGLLGTLGGAAILSATDAADSPAGVAGTLLASTTAGLLLAAIGTSEWDDPAGGELRSDATWRGPGPALLPGTDGKSVALGLNVASGQF